MTIFLPIKTISEANNSPWTRRQAIAKAARTGNQRRMAENVIGANAKSLLFKVKTIKLTRVCPPRNKIRDGDNLQSALKHIRDGVTLGLVGGKVGQYDSLFTWEYFQKAGPKNSLQFGVLVEIIP